MSRNKLTETIDRWILPLRGSTVTKIDWGTRVTLTLDSYAEISVGSNATLREGPLSLVESDPVTVAKQGEEGVDALLGQQILSAVAFKSGALRIVFSNAWFLVIEQEDQITQATVTIYDAYTWERSKGLRSFN